MEHPNEEQRRNQAEVPCVTARLISGCSTRKYFAPAMLQFITTGRRTMKILLKKTLRTGWRGYRLTSESTKKLRDLPNAKRIFLLPGNVMELRGLGMDKWMQRHLSEEDFAFWKGNAPKQK